MDQCSAGAQATVWASLFAVINTALLVFNQWDRRRSLKRIEKKVDESSNHTSAASEV